MCIYIMKYILSCLTTLAVSRHKSTFTVISSFFSNINIYAALTCAVAFPVHTDILWCGVDVYGHVKKSVFHEDTRATQV